MLIYAYFYEDSGHTGLIGGLVKRVAQDMGVDLEERPVVTKGGSGRVMEELQAYVRDIERGRSTRPDLLVVALDADTVGEQERRRRVKEVLQPLAGLPCLVVAVPRPHVEKWYLLDSQALKNLFGQPIQPLSITSDKPDYYKKELGELAARVGSAMGMLEWGGEIAARMSLQPGHLGCDDFERFIRDLRGCLRGEAD